MGRIMRKFEPMKISVVVTVKNDREGEQKLRHALAKQTKKPGEVIIIHAEDYGNCSRAKGRNIGVQKAKNDVIAVTDVGCTPHKDWLEKLTEPFERRTGHSGVSLRTIESMRSYRPAVSEEPRESAGLQDDNRAVVAAGFYRVVTRTFLQKAIAPYLAVFPDQWTDRSLPASRSIAFTRRAWESVGGYPEDARSGAEDLAFASRLVKHQNITMLHAPDALVDWEPPQTLRAFFRDVVKHTKGNRETRYWPHLLKNYSVLFRWLVFLLVPWLIPVYLAWPIVKHHRRLELRTLLLLPFVQLVADAGVMYALFSLHEIQSDFFPGAASM